VSESHPLTIPLGVALVHLVSGEDLIARVDYDAENKVYVLHRPVSPVTQPKLDGLTGEQTGASIGLVPYRFFLDPNEPLLSRDGNVLFTGKIAEQLASHYTQMTSDIVVAEG
jgi:hypothetical protein